MTALPPKLSEQRKYASRLIADLDALASERKLAVYEQDARMVANWLLAALDTFEVMTSSQRIQAARRG